MYAHLFKDGTDNYLFIRHLGAGVSCHTQLVRHLESGQVRVRKVLHRRLPLGHEMVGPTRIGRGGEAGPDDQFTNDARIANILASHALNRAIILRVPAVLSDATIPDPDSGKTSRVSYWSFCNGGDVGDFAQECRESGAVVPQGLVFRFLRQVLETLHFMYTGLPHPLIHGDLNSGNILLHLAPGNAAPDFHVVDFGTATWGQHINSLQDIPRSDLDDIMRILVGELMELTLDRHQRGVAAGILSIEYMLNHDTTNPICVAYQMLARLDHKFRVHLADYKTAPSGALALPDLTEVLRYVTDQSVLSLPQLILDLEGRNNAIQGIFRRRIDEANNPPPKLYPTMSGILQARNVPGPWYAARVKASGELVSVDRERHHRPNEDNAGYETDENWCDEDSEAETLEWY